MACCCSCVFFAVALFFIALKIYTRVSLGVCKSRVRLDGKTVIVTGANTGIGYETAKDLARRGARVILACRNLEKTKKAKAAIDQILMKSDVVVKKLDLSSLKSVNEFSDDIIKNESRLDILINNAGMAGVPEKTITEDGLELQMASNYFGHYLLTLRLLDLMKRTGKSRIVNVSSTMHWFGRLGDLSNINSEKDYGSAYSIYSRSKLANVLFTRELAQRLYGTDVTVNSLCPGSVITEIGREQPKPMALFQHYVVSNFMKSSDEGAQTSIYAAVSEEINGVSGKHFRDCSEAWISYEAHDVILSRKLWDLSSRLVGLKEE